VFSQRHRREYFIGSAKLPVSAPLKRMIAIPNQKCSAIGLPIEKPDEYPNERVSWAISNQ
jgi:hypothetical protein